MSEADVIRDSLQRCSNEIVPAKGGLAAFRHDFYSAPSSPSAPSARPQPHKPTPAEIRSEQLARVSADVASDMSSSFLCARGVQTALLRMGLREFYGAGDAWDLGAALKRSGKFQLIPETEARRGDIGVQAWSRGTIDQYSGTYHGRNLGDIFVVQSNRKGQITQSNDHFQPFSPNDSHYDPRKRYFLRFV